jgi:hypothetical protein
MSCGGMIHCLAIEDHCILDTRAQKIVPAATKLENSSSFCLLGNMLEGRNSIPDRRTSQTSTLPHLAFCSMGTEESFLKVKHLQYGDHHSRPSRATTKEAWNRTSIHACSHGLVFNDRDNIGFTLTCSATGQ